MLTVIGQFISCASCVFAWHKSCVIIGSHHIDRHKDRYVLCPRHAEVNKSCARNTPYCVRCDCSSGECRMSRFSSFSCIFYCCERLAKGKCFCLLWIYWGSNLHYMTDTHMGTRWCLRHNTFHHLDETCRGAISMALQCVHEEVQAALMQELAVSFTSLKILTFVPKNFCASPVVLPRDKAAFFVSATLLMGSDPMPLFSVPRSNYQI